MLTSHFGTLETFDLPLCQLLNRACLKHEMAKWRNDEMAKWRNGEMTKWRNGEMELKTRATVIKYELPSEIGSCFHLLPNLFCG